MRLLEKENISMNIKAKLDEGYIGHSKSYNAYNAENENKFPASIADKKLNVPSGAVKAILPKSEWHHTGSYYNKTDYYDIDLLLAVKNNDETALSYYEPDEIEDAKETYEKLKTYKKPKAESNKYIADVEWLSWSGTRNHPIATEHKVTDVEVEEKGSFYYFNDEYGNKIKKKIGSNGTYVKKKEE